MEFYRQGDVGIVRVSRIPPKATPVERDQGRIVLAYGEVTGHAHAIAEESATLVRSSDGRTFLRLEAPAVVRHEEHAPVTLPPGRYEVRRQREYSPEAIRDVAD
jgi:hypothetical protein